MHAFGVQGGALYFVNWRTLLSVGDAGDLEGLTANCRLVLDVFIQPEKLLRTLLANQGIESLHFLSSDAFESRTRLRGGRR